MLILRFIIVPLIVLVCAIEAYAFSVHPLIDIDLRGARSGIEGGEGSWGLNAWGLAVPALEFGENDFVLPAYSFSFTQYEFVIEEESLFAKRSGHFLTLIYKHKFSDTLEAKVNADGRYSFNNETKDELWGTGLYDYYDLGGGATITYSFWIEKVSYPFSLSCKYYQRKYPNYPSLTSTVGDEEITEEKPKDFDAINGTFSASYSFWTNSSINLMYNYLAKDYVDAHRLTNQGVMSAVMRRDIINYIDMDIVQELTPSIIANLTSNTTWYRSNQNVYDTDHDYYTTMTDPPSGYYTEDYYSYWSIETNPSITLKIAGWPELKLTYGYLYRRYLGRHVQDSSGTYYDELQVDHEHSLTLNAKYPIIKYLSIVAGVNGLMVKSNQAYQDYYSYTYNSGSVSLGVSFTY